MAWTSVTALQKRERERESCGAAVKALQVVQTDTLDPTFPNYLPQQERQSFEMADRRLKACHRIGGYLYGDVRIVTKAPVCTAIFWRKASSRRNEGNSGPALASTHSPPGSKRVCSDARQNSEHFAAIMFPISQRVQFQCQHDIGAQNPCQIRFVRPNSVQVLRVDSRGIYGTLGRRVYGHLQLNSNSVWGCIACLRWSIAADV